jgi:hypothetical protein
VQKLNLIAFAAGEVKEPCATAPQVMRCNPFFARSRSDLSNNLPQHFRCRSSSPHASCLIDGPGQRTVSVAGCILPPINSCFHPRGDWHRPDVPGFANEVRDDPVFLAQRLELTRNASSSPRRNPHPINIASMA